MSWTSILKQTALVGRDARSPNIWLHRQATTRNLGRPMTSKPANLSTIPIQVPAEKFEEYYNFLAYFYSRGDWKLYTTGSLIQSITVGSVEKVLKEFERGKIKVDRKYSKGLDEATEKVLQNTIQMMKKTAELLMVGSRSRIREGRDLMRYAKQLEETYDKGILKHIDILKGRRWFSSNYELAKSTLLEVVESIPKGQIFNIKSHKFKNTFKEQLIKNGIQPKVVGTLKNKLDRWMKSVGSRIVNSSPLAERVNNHTPSTSNQYSTVIEHVRI